MKYGDYPGDIDTPIPLIWDPLPKELKYGDIVVFPEKSGMPQLGDAHGRPFTLHPKQKYVLVRKT